MPALLSAPASAQDPLKRYPENYKLVFDNPQVAVIRVHYGPHETVGVHDHSDLPTLFVYLNDSGIVRFHIEDIPPSVLTRPASKLGSFRYIPGRRERHSVENLSGESSEFLRIELKQFPLQGGETFGEDPPASPAGPRDKVEFSNDQLAVERVLCAAGTSCALSPAAEPSVVVALSAIRLSGSVGGELKTGEMRWIEANEREDVSAGADGTGHLLRVFIKSPKAGPVSWGGLRRRTRKGRRGPALSSLFVRMMATTVLRAPWAPR